MAVAWLNVGWPVTTSCVTAPGTTVIGGVVAAVRPLADAWSVNPLPTVFNVNPVNVTTPLTAFTVSGPPPRVAAKGLLARESVTGSLKPVSSVPPALTAWNVRLNGVPALTTPGRAPRPPATSTPPP